MDDDLTRALATWREAVAETKPLAAAAKAAIENVSGDIDAQLTAAETHAAAFRALFSECMAGRAYLAALDQRAEEPHAAHAGAPMTSRRACGCVRVQCDVCMAVLRDTYCSVHRPIDWAALDRQAGVTDAD